MSLRITFALLQIEENLLLFCLVEIKRKKNSTFTYGFKVYSTIKSDLNNETKGLLSIKRQVFHHPLCKILFKKRAFRTLEKLTFCAAVVISS